MKLRKLGVLASLVVLMGLPTLSHAVPMTWTYSGACLSGDCGIVPSITGTLTGDPAKYWPSSQLNEFVLDGDLSSYTFNVGSYVFSGTRAAGTYFLDAAGNIVSGSMSFDNFFKLDFLDVGSATWTFTDAWLFGVKVSASGTGGYTKVPEPGVLSLLGLGLLGFGIARRRRRA